ncbi:MAG: PQQ-binding-like beta-propeller repeat protein, partial [Verrucomicrobiales bacterium]
NKIMKNHHGGVILVEDHLYGYSDARGWLCQNLKTGEEVWSNEKDLGKGAIGCADGMLYCVDENDGTVVLIEASPKEWKESGRFKLDPQTKFRSPSGKIWTHPVIANGKLYLRDQDLFFCFDVKGS